MGSTVTKSTADDYSSLNLYQKLARITGDVGVIKKGGVNREQGYGFIEYAAVAGELRTLFAKYGVVIVPRMQRASAQSRAEITSKHGAKGYHVLVDFYFNVVNADKPEDKFTVSWTGEAADFGDKAINKAATSALKYYLMRQFNISEKGDDPDESTPDISETSTSTHTVDQEHNKSRKPPSDKQLGLIRTLAKKAGYGDDWVAGVIMKVNTSVDASKVIDQLQEKGEVKEERVWR